jgi:hypothetical protein
VRGRGRSVGGRGRGGAGPSSVRGRGRSVGGRGRGGAGPSSVRGRGSGLIAPEDEPSEDEPSEDESSEDEPSEDEPSGVNDFGENSLRDLFKKARDVVAAGPYIQTAATMSNLFEAYANEHAEHLGRMYNTGILRDISTVFRRNGVIVRGTWSAWYMTIIFSAMTGRPLVIGFEDEVGNRDYEIISHVRAIMGQGYIMVGQDVIPVTPQMFDGIAHFPAVLQDIIIQLIDRPLREGLVDHLTRLVRTSLDMRLGVFFLPQ